MRIRLRDFGAQVLPLSRAVLFSIVLLISLLLAFPIVESLLADDESVPLVIALAIIEVVIGGYGAVVLQRRGELVDKPALTLRWRSTLWLVALCLPWGGLIVLTRQAAYLGFVLYFLCLWLLPPALGAAAALGLAVLTGLGQSVHHGWSTAAFIGPLAAAAVLIALMLALRSIIAESSARAELIAQLEDAQAKLAESERAAGRINERARLGRELHDTVAQHLSSIQLLLHAIDRVDEPSTRAAHIESARQAAATALADTRAVIRDLTPAPLAGQTLAAAVDRVVQSANDRRQVRASASVDGEPRALPTATEATLIRIAQEAIANAEKHARGSRVAVRLSYGDDEVGLEITDDGPGFEVPNTFDDPSTQSFGLAGMRTRAADLGGYVSIVSEPGEGTLVSAQIPTERRR